MNIHLPRNWLLFSGFLLLIGAGWLWLSRAAPVALTSGKIPAPHQGFMAPDFALQDTSGRSVRLADLRGQPVLVNIWASWCGPCKAEMPALQRLYQDYQARGFEILAVNATAQDSQENALAFSKSLGLTFPILFDYQGEVSRLYQAQSLPSSFFINKDGTINEVVIGGPMAEALLRVRVDRLLDADSSSNILSNPIARGTIP